MGSFVRRTVCETVTWKGRGLHSGLPVSVSVHPAHDGLFFLSDGLRTEAVPQNVTDTARCTRLGNVSTIEHLMSALSLFGVTDALVEVRGGELPALDGAAREYCDAIKETTVQDLSIREVSGPFARVYHVESETKVAVSAGDGHWRYEYESGVRWPGTQHFESQLGLRAFIQEIAPARTFALEEEVEAIRAAGLGMGLDESSALVIGSVGYVNRAKFPDEPARHKLLDLIGDLWLSGVPYSMLNVVSVRGGHKANVATAKKLRESVRFQG